VVLNIGMAAKQYELHGRVSPSMILVNLFQGLYVWDALFQVRGLTHTHAYTHTCGVTPPLLVVELSEWVLWEAIKIKRNEICIKPVHTNECAHS
jgi:hypothetical protein